MQCTSPIYLQKLGLRVPCGHCVSCRISYSREWAVRCMNEFETSHNRGCFITLTYDEEHIPEDFGLHKEDLQKFFKRLRKRLGEHKIKYYACGEYGDEYGRPHYHAIIFNLSVLDCSILLPDVWSFGFFTIKPVFYESCKYVTGYVMKKYNGEVAREKYGDRQPPFRLSSLGLGKTYAIKHREQILDNLGVMQGGVNKGFPKYYKSLFEREDLDVIRNGLDHMTDYQFEKIKLEYKNKGWHKNITDKLIERDESEKLAYHNWLKDYNPEDISDWSLERYSSCNFVNWRRQVEKLRDLTVKAKCKLHESRKENKL